MSQQQYGLVLSGGGAKGAFEMGVWKALKESDYALGAVIGTSVGALNAAMIAQDDYQIAMEFWSNLTINQVLDLNKKMTNTYVEKWSKESFDIFRTGFLAALFSDGLDISPLRHNLTRLICEDSIRRSTIRFGLVTVDITSLKPRQLMIEDIPEGQLIDYLLASAALPIFQKQEIDGKTYLDGGFFDNVPINFMLDQHFNQIISVEFPVIGMRKSVRDKDAKIITVNNSEYLGGLLDFNSRQIEQNIQLGYLDALKVFGRLEGRYFYLNTNKSSAFFRKFINKLGQPLSNQKQMHKMLALLSLSADASQSDVVKALESLLQKTAFKNQPLGLAMLEITGKSVGVPRLENYPVDFFIQAILKELNRLLDENLTLLDNPKIIGSFLTPATSNLLWYNFITFYIVFLSIRSDLSPERMSTFLSKFSPDIALSMITVFYIHEIINH
ncbi:MAG: patatin-like phospholipase family protein [Acetobacterium sp.]|nr:patatin-like phospholipase family protein [Acetobacterium sp.]